MKKFSDVLKKYFSNDDIKDLCNKLDTKYRANIMNDRYFAKVGTSEKELFFNNLITEINLYKNNPCNENLPKMIDYFIDDKICLVVLERINAKTIGNERNNFNLHLSRTSRIQICESILKIKNIKICNDLNNTYIREERFDKYLELSKPYLSKSMYNKIFQMRKRIIKEKYKRIIAHGDLISTNVMIKNGKPFFIDWEFVSLKPKYYDLVYFLLFSKTNHSIDILFEHDFNIDIQEALKDGIILCLKEIQNNAKLYEKINHQIVDKNINRWKRELSDILRRC